MPIEGFLCNPIHNLAAGPTPVISGLLVSLRSVDLSVFRSSSSSSSVLRFGIEEFLAGVLDSREEEGKAIEELNVGRGMGLYGAITGLGYGRISTGSCCSGFRMHHLSRCLPLRHSGAAVGAALPELLSSSASRRSPNTPRSLVWRKSVQNFVPTLRNQRHTSIYGTLIPREDSEELKQQQKQLSTIAGDLPSSKSEAATVVEHVVFFKMKDDPKTEELFKELRSLNSLDAVSELSASKVLQILGANYTHVLHSRHPDKSSLEAYAVHPSHKAVVKNLAPFIDDRMAVDWEAVPVGLARNGGHGAARIALIKLADGLTEEESSQVFALLTGLKDKFPFIRQISAGFNLSPGRSKGFNLGFLAMFDNVEELEELNENSELHAELRKSRVSPFLEKFLIADIDSKYK